MPLERSDIFVYCLIIEKRIKITTLRFSSIKSVSVRRDKREKIEVVTINLYALKTCYDVGAFGGLMHYFRKVFLIGPRGGKNVRLADKLNINGADLHYSTKQFAKSL